MMRTENREAAPTQVVKKQIIYSRYCAVRKRLITRTGKFHGIQKIGDSRFGLLHKYYTFSSISLRVLFVLSFGCWTWDSAENGRVWFLLAILADQCIASLEI